MSGRFAYPHGAERARLRTADEERDAAAKVGRLQLIAMQGGDWAVATYCTAVLDAVSADAADTKEFLVHEHPGLEGRRLMFSPYPLKRQRRRTT